MTVLTQPEELPSIKYDKEFCIATAGTRQATLWKNTTTSIKSFSEKLSKTHRTHETLTEYLSMPKDAQDNIKDIGGYVGAQLKKGRRKTDSVANRQILTYDIDFGKPDTLSVIKEKLKNVCYTVSATHKHTSKNPKLRLIIYPDRVLHNEEYEPVMRKVAERIGMDVFCDSTYSLNGLFYWPSTSSDGDFEWWHNDAEYLKIDKILSLYGAGDLWKDASFWPRSSREEGIVKRLVQRQADPLAKGGIVGAFCRTVSIYRALDEFLKDVYRKESVTRYSFIEGTTSNGLVIYDNKFCYSNHSTDPAHAQCCNSFDIIRIHKFGHLDKGGSFLEATTKLESYKAMVDFAGSIDGVMIDMVESGFTTTADAFDAFAEEDEAEDPDPDTEKVCSGKDKSWINQLQRTENKKSLLLTWYNLGMILKNDPRINNKMKFNEFSNRVEKDSGEDLTKQELFQTRTFIGSQYRLNFSINDIKQAIEARAFENKYHPICDYIKSLTWDGIPRIETVFQDYVGSIDNQYVREVSKCWFSAAVYRVFEPGTKFDCVIVLSGPQGIGKTRFIETLGFKKWYGELSSFDPKIAMEELSGKWIVELPEMGVISKHELEQQKSFLSARYTRTRLAYEPLAVDFKRQCVFMGTTNENEYLKDSTGNRRWWPIDCTSEKFDIVKLKDNLDQIWAEAYQLYLQRHKLWLEDDVLDQAKRIQEEKREADPWEGLINEWLEEECPVERIRYEKDYKPESFFDNKDVATEIRKKVCILEIWKDCLKNIYESAPKDRRRIGHILNNNIYYEKSGNISRFGQRFGSQKAWIRTMPF